MKFTVLIALMVPLAGFADYVPDRTRPTAEAEMEAISGNGRFKDVRSVRMVELSTDGKGITHYEVTVDNQTYQMAVKKFTGQNCSVLFEAEGGATRLLLRDLSLAQCDFRAKHTWEAQLIRSERGRVSHLFIGGNPEHLVVTQ